MLNLLPQQEKVLLKKEYSARRVIVWLAAVSCALFVSLVLLAPSYFLTRVKAKEAQTELENTKHQLDATLPAKDIVVGLEAAVKNAADLKPLTKPRSVYDLLKIFESKPSTIQISSISFAEQSAGPSTINVGGTATDRESLIAFGRLLEGRVEFKAVDLPVSNFVKERNINFSMTVTLK